MVKVVLDSNQFIYSALNQNHNCTRVISYAGVKFECLLPITILLEVFQALKEARGKDFAAVALTTLQTMPIKIEDDSIVHSTLIQKYRDKGLKPADATIAAFVEHVGAEFIISENRHFLKELKTDKFKAVCAKEFLEVIE